MDDALSLAAAGSRAAPRRTRGVVVFAADIGQQPRSQPVEQVGVLHAVAASLPASAGNNLPADQLALGRGHARSPAGCGSTVGASGAGVAQMSAIRWASTPKALASRTMVCGRGRSLTALDQRHLALAQASQDRDGRLREAALKSELPEGEDGPLDLCHVPTSFHRTDKL